MPRQSNRERQRGRGERQFWWITNYCLLPLHTPHILYMPLAEMTCCTWAQRAQLMALVSQMQTASIFPVWHYSGHKAGWQLNFRLSNESVGFRGSGRQWLCCIDIFVSPVVQPAVLNDVACCRRSWSTFLLKYIVSLIFCTYTRGPSVSSMWGKESRGDQREWMITACLEMVICGDCMRVSVAPLHQISTKGSVDLSF